MKFNNFILIIITVNILIQRNSADDINKEKIVTDINKSETFSPRTEYTEWKPVGRGDPLKNDPTFDYSPPVLDRVKYWSDSKEKSKDVLLLGVSSVKKDTKHNAMRRNFYSSLPTRLMPPPMITSNEKYRWSNNKPNIMDSLSESSNEYVSVVRPNHNFISNGGGNNHPDRFHYTNRPHFKETYDHEFLTSMESQTHYTGRKPYLQALLQKESIPPYPTTTTMMMNHKINHPSNMITGPMPFVTTSPKSIMMNPTNLPILSTPIENKYFYSTNSFAIMPSVEVTTVSPFYSPTIPPATRLTSAPAYFIPTALPETTSEKPHVTQSESTTQQPLTTDPLFSHYKQPEKPIKGPMYLVIEGHSKVKTYGFHNPINTTNKQEAKIVLISDKNDPVIHHVVNEDDNGKAMEVKHLHMKQEIITKSPSTITTTEQPSSIQSLLSLLDSSFSDLLDTNKSNSKKLDKSKLEKNNKIIRLKRSNLKENKEIIFSKEIYVENMKRNLNNKFYKKGIVINEKI